MVDVLFLPMLLAALIGWLDRQQDAVACLIEENRILRGQLRGRRLRLSDDERCRLAVRGHRLGRRVLRQIATIVNLDTILRRHRQLIAQMDVCEGSVRWRGRARRDPTPGREDGGG